MRVARTVLPRHRAFNPNKLRAVRTAHGLSRIELAERAGVSPFSLRDFERGISRPSVNTLAALADELNVPLDELVAREARPVTATG